jgi:hypothetical protein
MTMRRLLGCRVLVLVFLGSAVAAFQAGRAMAGADLFPPTREAPQVLITITANGTKTHSYARMPRSHVVQDQIWHSSSC